jgi:hypothetical protein
MQSSTYHPFCQQRRLAVATDRSGDLNLAVDDVHSRIPAG